MYFTGLAEQFKARAEESDFQTAAREFNLFPSKESDYFPINYGSIFQKKPMTVNGQNSDELSSAVNNELFFEELFSLKKGEISEPIVLTNYLLVFEMTDEREEPQDDMENFKNNLKNFKLNTTQKELSQFVINQDLFDNRFFETMMKILIK